MDAIEVSLCRFLAAQGFTPKMCYTCSALVKRARRKGIVWYCKRKQTWVLLDDICDLWDEKK